METRLRDRGNTSGITVRSEDLLRRVSNARTTESVSISQKQTLILEFFGTTKLRIESVFDIDQDIIALWNAATPDEKIERFEHW